METFKPQKRESAVDIVLNNVKRLLINGELKSGDKIPNETELSKALSISRTSIREAMKILSAFGIIDIKPGNGTYVADSIKNGLFNPFLLNLILSKLDIEEITEFRSLIEIDIVNLIIKKSNTNSEEVAMLVDSLKRFQEDRTHHEIPPEQLAKSDIEFHRLMGRATKNRLVEKFYSIILEFLEPYIVRSHMHQEHGAAAVNTHEHIVDAILSKDLTIAEKAIEESVEVWRKLVVSDF